MMKVSIIIPIYNVEAYIEGCLDSVMNQTMTEGVECILVDDCGKDRSVEIASRMIDTYSGNIQFSLIHHKLNKGLSGARNTGIRAAKGDYLYFLDSDDSISNDCISQMWSKVLEYPGVDIVQGTTTCVSEWHNNWFHALKNTGCQYVDGNKKCRKLMLDISLFPVTAWNRLVRTDFIKNNLLFFKEGIIHEDNHWTYFLAKHVSSLAVCEYETYNYRINPEGIMSTQKEKSIHAYQIFLQDQINSLDYNSFFFFKECSLLVNTINKLKQMGCVNPIENLSQARDWRVKWLQKYSKELGLNHESIFLEVYWKIYYSLVRMSIWLKRLC